jgi:hypothetical protein
LEKEFLARGSSESNVQLEEIQITHESDVRGDFTIPSMRVSWNKRFDKEIKEFDFIKCDEEPCVYK